MAIISGGVTAALCGLLVQIAVRRFLCRHCPVTVSCLPHFAQPYRLVCNETTEAFFEGQTQRRDVERWQELLARYRRAYARFWRELRATCGAFFGRSRRGSSHRASGAGSWMPVAA